MKGIILAAGRGSRMRAATADKPKCMTHLAGKALLQWQLEALCAAGVADIAVVCGYKAEILAAASFAVPFHTILNPFWESGNMLSSLLCAAEWAAGEGCVISYADIIYAASHVASLLKSDFPVAMTYDTLWRSLWEQRFADPLADAESFREEDGRLVEIGGRAERLDDIQGQYMGLVKLTGAGWTALGRVCAELGADTAKTDMTTCIRFLLEKDVPVGAVPVAGKWCEVDSQSDVALYERMLQTPNWLHDWR